MDPWVDPWKLGQGMRYPKSGVGRKWTIIELKAITPAWIGEVLSDGDGLSGEVRLAGDGSVSVKFRYGFKWEGKKSWYHCGAWPAMTLDEIRTNRDNARSSVRHGINPNDQRKATRIENQLQVERVLAEQKKRETDNATVGALFDAWIADGVKRQDDNAELVRSFNKDVLPAIGMKPVKAVTEHDIRSLLRSMVARGVNRLAVLVSNDLKQMFSWAEKRQPWRRLLQEGNPTALVDVANLVDADYDLSNQCTRTLSPNEITELRDIFVAMREEYDAAPDKRRAKRPVQQETQLALWISLSTACRIGELLMAEWRHVNLDIGVWFIPKKNVKGKRGKKQDQVVYLSAFALQQFRALHALTNASRWCFPSTDGESHVGEKTVSKQVGDRQCRFKNRKPLKKRRNDDTLVLADGENGEWTPHDLRRTAATMMQKLGVTPEVIDQCQAHVLAGSKVRRHYLHYQYAEEKREAWQRLGERLTAILQGKDVDDSTRSPEADIEALFIQSLKEEAVLESAA